MRILRFFSALFAAALLTAGPVHADAGTDLTNLLRDYRNGARSLGSAADAATDRNGAYDRKGADKYLTACRQLNEHIRMGLEKIDRAALKTQDGISYDILKWDIDDEADELKPGVADRFLLMPLNQFDGRHLGFAREMQWRAETPLTQPKDYDDAIKRMVGFSQWLDAAIGRMREGVAENTVQPRIVVEKMIAETEPLAAADGDASVFLAPLKSMPASIEGAERTRITDAYREAVQGELIPAYRRLAVFLKTEYLPHAREAPGLWAMPDGRAMYLHLVRSETTEDLSPDAIHALGLSEVKRIETEMEAVKAQTGFTGSLAAFKQFLRSDPRFTFKDKDAMMTAFVAARDTALKNLDAVVSVRPKAKLTFRFYEDFAAPYRPAAEYAPGRGRRSGVVTLNASELSTRPTYTSEVLAIHEGIPGHHLQVALASENQALPNFRRYRMETAFSEGWGLYAESLGPELGLYTDPYQKFGALTFDAWRASRLVVDTGIHWLGWTRAQAIQFLRDHAALSENEAAVEADRYIAIPGQALAYKIGEREFLALRARAQAELGENFDVKRFHDALLRDGAMPLPILHAKMLRWIADQRNAEGGTPLSQ